MLVQRGEHWIVISRSRLGELPAALLLVEIGAASKALPGTLLAANASLTVAHTAVMGQSFFLRLQLPLIGLLEEALDVLISAFEHDVDQLRLLTLRPSVSGLHRAVGHFAE